MLSTLERRQTTVSVIDKAEIIGQYAGIDASSWNLCLVKQAEYPEICDAVEELALSSNAPNPFFGSAILKAAQRLKLNNDLRYLCLFKRNGTEEEIKLFAPVVLERIGITRKKVIRTWTHDFAPLGLPLVCGNETGQIVHAFSECMSTATFKNIHALVLNLVTKEADFINKIYENQTLSSQLLLTEHSTRAGLTSINNADYISTYLSGKRKQRHRKAMRELASHGDISYETITSPSGIKTHLECFFQLEAQGWKGRNKTALSNNPTTRTFAEEAVGKMAEKDQCSIYAMLLNNKTIASLITFEQNGHNYPWKICFNEDYSKYSVGNLLATYATAEMTKKPDFKNLDSLAAEYNETTRRLWPEEKEFFTVVIGMGKHATKNTISLARELNRILRVKRVLISLLKR